MRWGYGLAVATILALLSLYPQFTLIYTRGAEYNGAAFVNDNDESVYLAYTQALIDGRSRKNNIYSSEAGEPPETFLSIQALPAYAVALPARWLGTDAQTLFQLLSPLFAFAAALSLYWFFRRIIDDDAFAAAAAFTVLVLGASAAGYGAIKYFLGLGSASASLPFLRRYTPGLAFPFLFIVMGSVWAALKCEAGSLTRWKWVPAALSFAVLLYSYFFLWTAAAAWIALVFLLVLIWAEDLGSALTRFWLPFGAACLIFVTPYIWLLSKRAGSTDDHQLLERTRQLVLDRPPVWVGAAVLIALVVLVLSKRIRIEREVVFIASCALLPFAVFNQQILTGISLQPFHYNLYAAPYFALISLTLLGWVLVREREIYLLNWAMIAVVAAVTIYGIVESRLVTHYRLAANIARDAALPVSERLREIAEEDPAAAREQVTFNSDLYQADNQPSTAPQGVLWAEHLPWASPITNAAARRRYFAHLYYTNRDEIWLREALGACPAGQACKAIFGARVIPTLSIGKHDPEEAEIENIVEEFRQFRDGIGVKGLPDPIPSFAVIRNADEFDFSVIDRWFERDAGEAIGRYTIYRLTPRSPNPDR